MSADSAVKIQHKYFKTCTLVLKQMTEKLVREEIFKFEFEGDLFFCFQYDEHRVSMLSKRLIDKIMAGLPDVIMNGDPEKRYSGEMFKHLYLFFQAHVQSCWKPAYLISTSYLLCVSVFKSFLVVSMFCTPRLH